MLPAATNTEEAAIAAPSISGLRNPAASGIAAMLQPQLHPRGPARVDGPSLGR